MLDPDVHKYSNMQYYYYLKILVVLPLLTLFVILSMYTSTDKWWILYGILLYYPFHQLGWSIGMHKLFSHRSFTPVSWYPLVAVVISSICFYGLPVVSVATHRLHHKYSESLEDADKDPHSPCISRWHSFAGWLLTYRFPSDVRDYVKDINRDFKFLQSYNQIELFVPIVFHTTTYFISPTLFLVCLLASLLSFYSSLFINAYSHDPKTAKALNKKWLSWIVNPAFMHKYHHDFPKDYDFSHNGFVDYSAFIIDKFLKK